MNNAHSLQTPGLSFLLRKLGDAVVMFLSGWLSQIIYLESWRPFSAYYVPAAVIMVLLTELVFSYSGLHNSQRGRAILAEIGQIFFSLLTVFFLAAILVFLTKTGNNYSRGWATIWFFLAFFCLIGYRLLLRWLMNRLRRRGFDQRRVVIVGSGRLAGRIARQFAQNPDSGFRVIGLFSDDRDLPPSSSLEVNGPVAELAGFLERNRADQLWIALPLEQMSLVKQLMHELRLLTLDIRFVPDIFELRLLNHGVTEIAGLPVIDLSTSPMGGMNRLLKRTEDLILSVFFLALAAPLLPPIALLIKLSSPGPVFYKQKRLSWNGKRFSMYKFRSMDCSSEQGEVVWGQARAKRVTAIGRWLRRTSLDELPQLFNVLRGDMSIVGPRPERPEFIERFKHEIPGYMQKHMVKAGITGWAQINGLRGDTDLATRIEFDLYYIEHWSLWLDLKIIMLTPLKGLVNEHAY